MTDHHRPCPSTLGHGPDCVCKGAGVVDVSCDRCGGVGELRRWRLNHQNVQVTDGYGPCPDCDGIGEVQAGEPFEAEVVTWAGQGFVALSGSCGWCVFAADLSSVSLHYTRLHLPLVDEATAVHLCACGRFPDEVDDDD